MKRLSYYIYRYMDWVFNKYSLERKDDIKCLLIKSFIEAFKLDAEAPRLKEFSVVFKFFFLIFLNLIINYLK